MKPLIKKFGKKGVFSTIEAILWRIEARFGRLRRRFEAVRVLRQEDFRAEFVHEGGIKIILPRVLTLHALLGMDQTLDRSVNFVRSALSEALLRQTIFDLYANGHINSEKSIVDIGCWCADNTLAWATLIKRKATVFAIDPSSGNLGYAKSIATANGIENVTWVQAVCSDKSGETLGFTRSIEHASFHTSPNANAAQVTSKNRDEIIGSENQASIGLLHVDVEGFEERVLRGAANIIEKSNPVITFERHLCDDDSPLIFDLLAAKGYRIFMVNEVMTMCRLVCRNFIAFPLGFVAPAEMTQQVSDYGPEGFVPAVLAPNLLELDFEVSLGWAPRARRALSDRQATSAER
jgi:FkbM family methyltransferase